MPRRIRWLILLSLVVVMGGTLAGYLSRKGEPLRDRRLPPRIAAEVDQQTQAFSLSKTLGDHILYTLQAESVTNRKDTGKAILHGVSILLYGKQGDRRDRISTQECEFDPATGSLIIPGEVEMEFHVPVSASTSGAQAGGSARISVFTSVLSFDRTTGIAETEQSVRFRFPQGDGTSVGAVYNPQDESLLLQADVQITLLNSSREPNKPLHGEVTRLQAGKLRFRRGEQKVFLGAPVELIQGTRKIRSGDSEVTLDEQNRVSSALLGGGVVGSDQTPVYSAQATAKQAVMEFTPQGKVRLLRLEEDVHWSSISRQSSKESSAKSVELWFPEATGRLERIQAFGQVEVTFRGTADPAAVRSLAPNGRGPNPGSGTQILTAQQVRMTLAEDGETLRRVHTESSSTLRVLPSQAGQKQWTVAGGDFEIEFGPNGDLSQFSAERNVHVTAESAAGAPHKQSSRSDYLRAHFDPLTHTLDRVQQWGKFSYQDPDREARAERADYSVAPDEVLLEGDPVVWNPSARIAAEKILLKNATRELTAEGRVSSTHFPVSASQSPVPEPVHAVSDRMQYDLGGRRAWYQGQARLWQGTSLLLEGDSIELDQPAGELKARGSVYSLFQSATYPAGRERATAEAGQTFPPGSYAIRSNSVVYRQAERKALYQGSVRMQDRSRTLEAGQLEVFFRKEGSQAASGATPAGGQVERAVATDNVVIVEGTRKATGDRADYLPLEGRIQLVGRQATIFSPPQGLTQGARLTYLMADDRIQVDGEPGHPTETRGQVQR